jgi:hypothetical protein
MVLYRNTIKTYTLVFYLLSLSKNIYLILKHYFNLIYDLLKLPVYIRNLPKVYKDVVNLNLFLSNKFKSFLILKERSINYIP